VVLDLGSGTGSTARAFSGAFAGRWRFLDSDQRLLDIALQRHRGSEQVRLNLDQVDALPLDGVGLVTASALLDLMPVAWIERLAQRLSAARVPFYSALNYSGEMSWTPSLPLDTAVTEAFNRHQAGDKGLGPAAGLAAANAAARLFRSQGYDVFTAESPWVLRANQAALQSELLVGIAAAAAEIGQQGTKAWLASRQEALGVSVARVGHLDLLAIPV
jgi:hypothetical protein